MDIRETKTKMLKVADLRPNTGQIEGVPANPRSITKAEFDALCESMKADDLTGVLQVKVYKHAGEWVVLDGNMRLKAMQAIGIEEVQCVIVPEETNAATLRKIVINSNSTFGEWDVDMLANEWDPEELKNWGVDIPCVKADDFGTEFELPDGDKSPFQQMTFIIADAQAKMVQCALRCAIGNAEYSQQDTYGNTNRNGNAIALIVKQWLEQKGYGKM